MSSERDGAANPPQTADVVVIGGGIIGLSCAHYLERHGRSPLVVERGEIGHGSSHGNAGLVAPSHSITLPAPGVVMQGLKWLLDPTSPFVVKPRPDPALVRWLLRFAASARRQPMLRAIPTLRDLSRLSTALYDELARDVKAELGYHATGVLNVYRTPQGFAKGRREAELLERFDLPSEILDGDRLEAAEPGLRQGLTGGVLWPEDGYVDPSAFVATLCDDLRERGIQIMPHTEVLALSQDDGRASVKTTGGSVRCNAVVVAAGAWSAALLRAMGHRLQVEPAKGYSITIRQSATRLRRPLLLSEAKVAVTPLGSSLRLAGTLELGGLDASIDLRRLDAVRDSAEPYLRAGAGGAQETAWRGLRPLSADGLPTIGRLPQQRRIAVATGHGHIGVSLAPATGKLIAELLTDQTPTIDLTPLRPLR
jgi:D-amino-acid dehydrogenase